MRGMIYQARIRVEGRDKRGEKLSGNVTVAVGRLPASAGGGGGGGGMEVDGEEEEMQDGWEVVLHKKVADPLELKRFWGNMVDGLGREVVWCM